MNTPLLPVTGSDGWALTYNGADPFAPVTVAVTYSDGSTVTTTVTAGEQIDVRPGWVTIQEVR